MQHIHAGMTPRLCMVWVTKLKRTIARAPPVMIVKEAVATAAAGMIAARTLSKEPSDPHGLMQRQIARHRSHCAAEKWNLSRRMAMLHYSLQRQEMQMMEERVHVEMQGAQTCGPV